jgi:CheY-like chemotaxis protein
VNPWRSAILLVEDNAADAEFILEALTSAGHGSSVTVARDGVEAVTILGCGNPPEPRNPELLPRLVILDIKLPRLNGLEVLERIRKHEPTRDLPVVMFTSSVIERDVTHSYRLGVNSYVQKPVEFDHFRDVIRRLGDYWLSINHPPHPPRPGGAPR